MDDLSQRDLSQIPDQDLSPEERAEVRRRLDDFLARLREEAGLEPAEKKKPKRIVRWDPATLARRH